MAQMPSPEDGISIQTFVFLDLETTGLKGDDPRILELSMLAISRDDLLKMQNKSLIDEDKIMDLVEAASNIADSSSNHLPGKSNIKPISVPKLPRVLHKYTKLYYPRKIISPLVEEMTGLSNNQLHRLPEFSSRSAEGIALFLDLPRPIAFVAHNGERYDFPLLKAELLNVDGFDTLSQVRTVDTLTALKNIDSLKRKNAERLENDAELNDITELTELANSFVDLPFDDVVDGEYESRTKKRFKFQNGEEKYHINEKKNLPSTVHEQEVNHSPLQITIVPQITPVKDPLTLTYEIPQTPQKGSKHLPLAVTPETNKMIIQCDPGTPGFNPHLILGSKVRRSLNYSCTNGKINWDRTMSYKQVNIHKRLFDEEYDAHRAESDCESLLKICSYYGEEFVSWADKFCDKFGDVKPMWKKRNCYKV